MSRIEIFEIGGEQVKVSKLKRRANQSVEIGKDGRSLVQIVVHRDRWHFNEHEGERNFTAKVKFKRYATKRSSNRDPSPRFVAIV